MYSFLAIILPIKRFIAYNHAMQDAYSQFHLSVDAACSQVAAHLPSFTIIKTIKR